MLMLRSVYRDGNGTYYIQVTSDQEARDVRKAASAHYGVAIEPTREGIGLESAGQVSFNPAVGMESAVENLAKRLEAAA